MFIKTRYDIYNVFWQDTFYFFNFIYLFLERGKRRENKGEEHQCVVASHAAPAPGLTTQSCALTGIRTGDLWFTGWHSNH